MPCELRHCTWLPEIDAYTLRTSQPAINSASSTARWIDCTVESISTTTPRRRPRDSCEPMPITSIGSPGAYSPTSAVTLEVPMSRPTISDLSPLRFMWFLAATNARATTPRQAGGEGWLGSAPVRHRLVLADRPTPAKSHSCSANRHARGAG